MSDMLPKLFFVHFCKTSFIASFFETVHNFGCIRVRCVTSPVNKSSIAYHLRMGFQAEPSDTQEDGVPYHLDYDGIGEHRVLFVKYLHSYQA